MATTFDTLLYAKQLRATGVPEPQVEVHAEALKHLTDDHFATKQDIRMLKTVMKTEIDKLKIEIDKYGWKLNVLLGLFGIFGTLITLSQYIN